MLRLKDAIRIVPYFVLPQFYPIFAYREADAPLLCSYRGGSLSHKTTPVRAHRGFRLLTLASFQYRNTENEASCQYLTCGILDVTSLSLIFVINFLNAKSNCLTTNFSKSSSSSCPGI